MQDNFDFLIDFNNITYSPLPETFEKESQEVESFIEIFQNGKRSYQCTQQGCGKTFRYKSEANRHIIIHQKDKNHRCNISGCNKAFKRQETLEEHMKLHGGDLPFSCDEYGCGRRFASKPALRYHMLRHQNNREFRCDIDGCDKTFLTMSHLRQHQMSSLHSDKSVSDVSESKPYKIRKSEFETDVSTSSEDYMKEMSELLQNTLAENRLLKEKLETQESKVSSDEESQFSFPCASPISFSDIVEPSLFFDKYEMDIMEFLSENDKTDF